MSWDQADGEPSDAGPAESRPDAAEEIRPWAELVAPDAGDADPPHRRRRGVGWLIAGALVICVLGAVAATSMSSKSESPTKLVIGAPERTAAHGAVHLTSDISVTKDGAPYTTLQMSGDEDAPNRSSTMTISAGPIKSEIRLIGGIEYFSSSLAKLPLGKSWVKIDPAAVGITPAAAAPNDPMAQLGLLGGLVGDPLRTGTGTVDGVAVTRYDVTLDFTNVVDKLSQGASALGGSDAFINGLKSVSTLTDLHHVPGQVALDDQKRARSFTFQLHIVGPRGTVDETVDMKFSRFGETVGLTPPPDDQVVPFSAVPDVFKNMTGG